jgi:arsenite/tail-anchored protein-transporting ATPase
VRVRDLLGCRLVLVTGKGGTGKSSLAAALGLLSASRGQRTVVVEVDSFRPALTELLGVEPGFQPVPAGPQLWVSNATWQASLEDWLERTVPASGIVKLILNNRVVQLFLDATPGARETVLLSRIVSLLERYDRVVVDLPASGHALSLLRVPHLARRLMRSGPIRERSEEIVAALGAPTTALLLVALPEEMVVTETCELHDQLRREVPELAVPLVVLNRASRPTLEPAERTLLDRLAAVAPAEGPAHELVLAATWEAALEHDTLASVQRLKELEGLAVLQFPRLGALGGFEGGAAKVVRQMATALARKEARERAAEEVG